MKDYKIFFKEINIMKKILQKCFSTLQFLFLYRL